MTTLGLALLGLAGLLLFAAMISIYSTTMTVRRSRVSPVAFVLGGAAILACAAGLALLLL